MAESSLALEQRALKVSIAGALFMSVLGVGFAITTKSEAILLDGVFSGIGFFMAIATLKVAALVTRPDDERFHYGYAHFGPLINVLKSLLMVVLCVFALLSSVSALLGEGRPLQIGNAVIYGIISTLGCICFALYLSRAAKTTASLLVSVDSQGWIIDSMMSGAVLLSFIAGYLAIGTTLEVYLDYLDPLVVTVLCLLALPMPIRILMQNGRDVLLMAPEKAVQDDVIERVARAMKGLSVADYRLRMLKMGSTMNILLHIKMGPDFKLKNVTELDAIRTRVVQELNAMEGRVTADLVFVDDMTLAD
ncbi:cation diffusion facilitator family transporter [Halieaceae bacterium IMCC14734]|uniref:Cation diffusion facilitator family transporter n=1 Tax=Candidatus Litorirhabdus singularis TaxID=2518993 RepID=A0ABT3TJX5_9GAMM|nr:cation diffusion facilitator family transporter [Candidatus Litorirhabdus singularis]MCX2982530.1 cation diffusion facilitator family transporter [Candidatus Litorirhabdus singularis]